MRHKVRNALPAPIYCDCCCSLNVELTTNDRIYGRQFGEWPYCYFCNDCKAAVGCHPGTEIPLGRMADRQTRRLRKIAHDEFDRLWRGGFMTRDKAYQWLAAELQIEIEQCHMSWLTKDQLKQAAQVSKVYIQQNAKALIRRRKKQDAKSYERNEREHRRFKYKRANR